MDDFRGVEPNIDWNLNLFLVKLVGVVVIITAEAMKNFSSAA